MIGKKVPYNGVPYLNLMVLIGASLFTLVIIIQLLVITQLAIQWMLIIKDSVVCIANEYWPLLLDSAYDFRQKVFKTLADPYIKNIYINIETRG